MPEHNEETEMTDAPICPHCYSQDHEWWDGLPPKHDGDSWVASCPSCGEEYCVTMFVSKYFNTSKVNDKS